MSLDETKMLHGYRRDSYAFCTSEYWIPLSNMEANFCFEEMVTSGFNNCNVVVMEAVVENTLYRGSGTLISTKNQDPSQESNQSTLVLQ